MSFGSNKSSSQSTSNSQSNSESGSFNYSGQEYDPTLTGLLTANAARAAGLADTAYTPYSGQRVAGVTDAQRRFTDALGGIVTDQTGALATDAAKNTAMGLGSYQPEQVSGTRYDPFTGQASTVNRGDIRTVESGPVSAEAIRGYYDPFVNDVIDTSLADINRQATIADLGARARATSAGAWGGSGEGVLRGLTQDNFARAAASTASGLRSQGYTTALGAAQQDAQRRLAADTTNAGYDYGVATGNADRGQSMTLANLGYQNQAASSNAEREQAARLANQGASLSAAGIRQAGAGLLGTLSQQQLDQAQQRAGLLGTISSQDQAQRQRELDAQYEAYQRAQDDPFRRQEMLNQSLGLLPNGALTTSVGGSFGNSNSTSTSQSTGRSSGFNFALPNPPPIV